MISLLSSFALAGADHTHTASTASPGEVVLRLPTGPSSVGVADGTELWTTPLDIGIGGPRVGVEQALLRTGATSLAVRPSLGMKTTARRYSTRVDTIASVGAADHRLSVSLGVDLRWLHRLELGEERQGQLSVDRLQLPLTVVHDWTAGRNTLRSRVNLPLRDRDRTLAYGSGSVSLLHDFGRLHTETGVGLLVGHPRDQYALDTYEWFFVVPYPKLDLWVVL